MNLNNSKALLVMLRLYYYVTGSDTTYIICESTNMYSYCFSETHILKLLIVKNLL